MGIWKNLKNIGYYKSGWTGNKTVWTFGLGEAAGYFLFGLETYVDLAKYSPSSA